MRFPTTDCGIYSRHLHLLVLERRDSAWPCHWNAPERGSKDCAIYRQWSVRPSDLHDSFPPWDGWGNKRWWRMLRNGICENWHFARNNSWRGWRDPWRLPLRHEDWNRPVNQGMRASRVSEPMNFQWLWWVYPGVDLEWNNFDDFAKTRSIARPQILVLEVDLFVHLSVWLEESL